MMGRRSGIRAAYRIAQNNTKTEDTAPELAFEKLFEGRVIKPPRITIHSLEPFDESESIYLFKPDFQFIDTNLLVEIDGPYHRTPIQERKTRWRDSQLFAKGYRVLHIDSELLTTKRYNAETVAKVEAFLRGNRQVEHLYQ